MEQLDYNLLYRWFVGLSPDDPIWDPTTFTKNRDRTLIIADDSVDGEIALLTCSARPNTAPFPSRHDHQF